MNLHENPNLFRDAILATAQLKKIREIYIEKDYWVTVALYKIFHSEIGVDAVFKGGTALSKCHKLIQRFSEDLDMVVIHREGDNGNRLKNKLKAITDSVIEVLPEIELEGITNKRGMIRKTAHTYPKFGFRGAYGQIREQIIIEATWLGRSEPFTQKNVNSFIGEMMEETGQLDLMKVHDMQPFQVQVLAKERTFCEKIMSLVRFSLTENPYADLANKIRHVYDLHMMLRDEEIKTFFESPAFAEMLVIVGTDDIASFKNNNAWLAVHPAETIIFSQPKDTWSKIRTPYQTTFKDLLIRDGELPTEDKMIATLEQIGVKLTSITWGLNPTAK